METEGKRSTKKPTKIDELTKEQIRKAIIKKRECNAKAQTIVESLLESCINEDYFLKCLPDINQSHFEDIVEERAILQLCGYPLCQKSLSKQDIPKQKYRISLKTNKVYDITARKNFCSNICYKSAMHVKKQMLTSPLWFREYEVIPKFYLLPLDSIGSLGQEVDLSLTERINLKPQQKFTSYNDFTSASLQEIDDCKNNDNMLSNSKNNKNNLELSDYSDINKEIDKTIDNKTIHTDSSEPGEQTKTKDVNSNVKNNTDSLKVESKKPIKNPLNIVGEVIEKPERKIDPILLNKPTNINNENKKIDSDNKKDHGNKKIDNEKKKIDTKKALSKKKPPSVTAVMIEVEKCLAEWFTIDTLVFLFGKDKLKEMVADKGQSIKDYLNNYANSISYNSNTYDQYQALCRKLNLLELEDRRFDQQTLARETKPLPDYSILKEESKKMQLKVKAFFAGETEIPEVDTIETEEPNDEANTTQLPLVDSNAQNALRRRIVCQHLNKVLPDLLKSLGLLTLTISSDIRLLVNTFKLKANNIMFKPIQWTLIAIIFIKLLSIRDQQLEYLLKQPTAFQHMQLLLLSYKQDGGYLDRLILWLTDINRLLDVNDTQLTIE